MADVFTITDYVTYLDVEEGLSPLTIDAYMHNVNRYVSYLGDTGITAPSMLTPAHVTGFIDALLSFGLSLSAFRATSPR